jgi:hypothetical protein
LCRGEEGCAWEAMSMLCEMRKTNKAKVQHEGAMQGAAGKVIAEQSPLISTHPTTFSPTRY